MIIAINVRKEDIPLWDEFDKICAREGQDRVERIRNLVVLDVKNHKEGNSTFKMDRWVKDPSFLAMPTIGEVLTVDRLDGMTEKNLELMQDQVVKRYNEISSALHRKGPFLHV